MMGHRQVEQAALFYEFSLERHIPTDHLLRSIDRFVDLEQVRRDLAPFYISIGRPSIDPELMIRMLWSVTAMASVMSAGCARKWRCILLTAGSASSISTTRFRTIQRSR